MAFYVFLDDPDFLTVLFLLSLDWYFVYRAFFLVLNAEVSKCQQSSDYTM